MFSVSLALIPHLFKSFFKAASEGTCFILGIRPVGWLSWKQHPPPLQKNINCYPGSFSPQVLPLESNPIWSCSITLPRPLRIAVERPEVLCPLHRLIRARAQGAGQPGQARSPALLGGWRLRLTVVDGVHFREGRILILKASFKK